MKMTLFLLCLFLATLHAGFLLFVDRTVLDGMCHLTGFAVSAVGVLLIGSSPND